jgi:hypothetical protein
VLQNKNIYLISLFVPTTQSTWHCKQTTVHELLFLPSPVSALCANQIKCTTVGTTTPFSQLLPGVYNIITDIHVLTRRLLLTGQMYFVLCRLYPSSLQLPRQLAPTCHHFTLNLHCLAGAFLPIYMTGEVSWDPKRLRA